jgi:hypothetical protein
LLYDKNTRELYFSRFFESPYPFKFPSFSHPTR